MILLKICPYVSIKLWYTFLEELLYILITVANSDVVCLWNKLFIKVLHIEGGLSTNNTYLNGFFKTSFIQIRFTEFIANVDFL